MFKNFFQNSFFISHFSFLAGSIKNFFQGDSGKVFYSPVKKFFWKSFPFFILQSNPGTAPLVPKMKMGGVAGGGFAEFMKNNPSGIEKEKKEKKSKKRKHGEEKKSRKERKVNIDDDDL